MLKKSTLTFFLALVLLVGFLYGVTQLFFLRYARGDVYPPYSSLRADPLGTKVLAEALAELPNVEVRRNFKPLPKLRAENPVTLVYTGVPHRAFWTEPELAAFDALVVHGSRAVFTFYPIDRTLSKKQQEDAAAEERIRKSEQVKDEDAKSKKDGKQNMPGEDARETDQSFVAFSEVGQRWGFGFDYLPERQKAYDRKAALIEPGGHLEPDLAWHSRLFFTDLKPQWKVLYVCDTKPVVIERKYGDGSIVLVADSFLISNEALREDRHPRLLARLFDGPPTVIFDEESHGLRESPGIASLARKYRLHGVVGGLILLAIFFVWKNAVRFIPVDETPLAEGDVVTGKDSREGFINLLRRTIRPAAIFETCLGEWRKAFARQPREWAKVEELWAQEQARPARERDPVATYRAISRALARKL